MTSEQGDITLFADYDGDGSGSFRQHQGVIEAKNDGNISVDSSQVMELHELTTEKGHIKVGEKRAPKEIAGEPYYVHNKGDFEIIKKAADALFDVALLKLIQGSGSF